MKVLFKLFWSRYYKDSKRKLIKIKRWDLALVDYNGQRMTEQYALFGKWFL